ncbi:hypothetical protein [Vreelandella sp. GE22]
MTPEASRRHYLDAMGITAWACRYQLPNALPTEACEWEAPAAAAEPRQALHALLEEQSAAPPKAPASTQAAPEPGASTPPKSARALLGDIVPPERAEPVPAPAPEKAPASPPVAHAEPVVFTVTCVCIDGRLLSLHPGAPGPGEQRLLGNMLSAAGLIDGALPQLITFNWPPVANAFTSEDPMGEAREGLAAFIEGAARRQGWQLERLLWWAKPALESDEPGEGGHALSQVLELRERQSHTLGLPVWQGPALDTLTSATAKRALWPELLRLAQGSAARST